MKNGVKRLAIGAAIGAATGYLAGILTAPKSGKETRKDISTQAQKAKTEAEKKLKALHSELSDLLNQAKKNTSKLKQGASKEFANAFTKGQFAKEKARQILSSIHEGDSDDKDLQKAVKDVNQAITHLKTFLSKSESAGKTK